MAHQIGSLSPECNALKSSYDECFNAWFSEKFLKGDKDISVCDPQLKAYTDCVKAAMIQMKIDVTEVSVEISDPHPHRP